MIGARDVEPSRSSGSQIGALPPFGDVETGQSFGGAQLGTMAKAVPLENDLGGCAGSGSFDSQAGERGYFWRAEGFAGSRDRGWSLAADGATPAEPDWQVRSGREWSLR